MKYLITVVAFLFFTLPALSEIKEFDPTKVIIDTETATVIYVPRELDYEYSVDTRRLKYETRPSLREIVFGRKSCSKGCGK